MSTRRLWVTVALAAATLAALVFLAFTPASPAEPGIAPRARWTVEQAEAKAIAALDRVSPGCHAEGFGSESFAEANSTTPHGFQIIAQCVTITGRSTTP